MSVDTKKLPTRVLVCIEKYLLANKYPTSKLDSAISTMSRTELMDAYLRWNGIINWTEDIIAALDGITEACKVVTTQQAVAKSGSCLREAAPSGCYWRDILREDEYSCYYCILDYLAQCGACLEQPLVSACLMQAWDYNGATFDDAMGKLIIENNIMVREDGAYDLVR